MDLWWWDERVQFQYEHIVNTINLIEMWAIYFWILFEREFAEAAQTDGWFNAIWTGYLICVLHTQTQKNDFANEEKNNVDKESSVTEVCA